MHYDVFKSVGRTELVMSYSFVHSVLKAVNYEFI